MAEVSSTARVNVDAKELFQSVITPVLSDDGLTVPTEAAKACLQAANKFSDAFKEPSRENGWKSLRMDGWKSFQSFENGWKSFLDVAKIPCDPLFYQHFSQELFEKLLQMKLKPASVSLCEEEVTTASLTSDEENAVRYVAGYVLRKIKDGLKLPDDKPIVDILTQLIQTPIVHLLQF